MDARGRRRRRRGPGRPGPAARSRRRSPRPRKARAAEIVKALNPEQARAVTTTEGPLLILAGAGSGKTRVLAHRIAYLVGVNGRRRRGGSSPSRSPTERRRSCASGSSASSARAAATSRPARSTRSAPRVLRSDGEAIGVDRRFVIYDTDDQQSLMKQILREEDMPLTGEFRPSAVLGAISRAKNEMLDPGFLSEHAANHRERTIARLASRYQERLRKAKALDFDDLLLEAVRLFDEAPDVLAKYQEKWRYLHVDEYQDTNRAQYLWVRSLAAKHHNLCVVGDDDQSIYSWRGADLRNILDFERDWPKTAVVKLEQNYRSTQLILDAAHAVVSRNEARKDKKLWTDNAGGTRIQRFEAYNEEEEAEWIARQVESLVAGRGSALTRKADEEEERFRARDIAVMYRMNAQSRAIEESFLRYGLRYQLVGGTRFYARREVKDALAYLRILRSDTDSVSFERIINVPARGIGDKTVEVLRAAAAREGGTTWSAIEAGRPRRAAGHRAAGPEPARGLRGAGPAAAGPDRRAGPARTARRGPRGVRLPRDARRRLRGRRGALGQPARAARGHDPLRRPLARGRARPAARGDRARRRPGLVRGRRRRGHAHHPPRRQGPRVPGRVHRRPRGGPLPAQPGARRREGARGGAPARLRRDHPGQAPAVPVARVASDDVGDGPADRPVAVPAGDPGRADGRAAAGWPRRRRPRSGPRLRGAARESVRYPRAWRWGWAPRFDRGAAGPGAPAPGDTFRPSRDLAAKREAFAAGAPSGTLRRPLPAWDDEVDADAVAERALGGAPAPATKPARPIIPGERQFRDGDRVRHGRWGDGIVVTSKLTRSDEEVTVAFRDPNVGRKQMLASLANLEIVG